MNMVLKHSSSNIEVLATPIWNGLLRFGQRVLSISALC